MPKSKRASGFKVVDTSLRYLEMLEFIPREPEAVTVEQIGQSLSRRGFDIDVRTIQRNLNTLAPIFDLTCCNEGKLNRWSYSSEAPIKFFPSMDENTALSFQLMQAFLKPLLAPETLNALDPLFRKSAERLSQRSGRSARWQEKIHVLPLGLPRKPPKVDPEVQFDVYQSLLYEFPMEIVYQARSSAKPKVYVVSPLGLVIRDYITYLVAVLHEDGSIRQFAMHRFKSAGYIDVKYCRPAGFKLESYANESFGFLLPNESQFIDLELRMDKAAALSVIECPVSIKQVMSEGEDGSFILKATLKNTLELRRWIHAFGLQVEVLKPIWLRDDFANELAEMLKRYRVKMVA
jgi:predicted DNA-binding transcriptional regulator YafY